MKKIPAGKITSREHDKLQEAAAKNRKRDADKKRRKGQSLRPQADARKLPRYDMLTHEKKMAIAADFVANHYNIRATCAASGIGLGTMWRLRHKDLDFSNMVRALDANIRNNSIATVEEVKQEITNILRSNIARYYALTEEGDLVLDLSNCSPEDMAAIRSMSSEEHFEEVGEEVDGEMVKKVYVRVRKPQITLHSKTEALKLLGTHYKLFDQGAPSGGGAGVAPGSAPPPALNIKFIDVPEDKQ